VALSEAEIVRYSRQILLKDVGGAGQERLLETVVELVGEGPALAIAAAYLSASGVRVRWPKRPIRADEAGFEFAAGEVPPELSALPTTELAIAPTRPNDRLQVVIGSRGDEALVLFASADTCRACWSAQLAGLTAPPVELAPVLGTVAAMSLQRRVLGLGAPAGAVLVTRSGLWSEQPISRCETCG
jgi:hypothetical protein